MSLEWCGASIFFRRSKAEHADAAATRGGREPRRRCGDRHCDLLFWSRGRSHRHRSDGAAWSAGRLARGMAVAPAGARARVNRTGCWQWWPAPDRRRVESPGARKRTGETELLVLGRPEPRGWMRSCDEPTTTPHGQKQTEPGEYCTYGVLVGSTAPLVVCVSRWPARHVPSWESRIHTHTVLRNCG